MITPGEWQLAGPERGEPMTRDHPGVPDTPAYIYVKHGDQEVQIAHVLEPMVWHEGSDEPGDEPGDMALGDALANAKLMTFSPALVRFVQKLAGQVEGGIITAQYREEAKDFLKQLAEVEVTSDADRW